MKIADGLIVVINYELLDAEGNLFESSADEGPMSYMQGNEEIPPPVEAALEGCEVGAKLEISVPPEDAYGEHDVEGIFSIPQADFPDGPQLIPGEWIREGACVIDVGMNRVDAGGPKPKLLGDVEYEAAAARAGGNSAGVSGAGGGGGAAIGAARAGGAGGAARAGGTGGVAGSAGAARSGAVRGRRGNAAATSQKHTAGQHAGAEDGAHMGTDHD